MAPFAGLVAAGDQHSLAVGADGQVRTWGANTSGQLGNGSAGAPSSTPVVVSNLTSATAVAAGASHSVALRSDGTVWAWGDDAAGQLGRGTVSGAGAPASVPQQVPGVASATAVASGAAHSMAVVSDGTVRAWGANDAGQIGNGTTSLTPSAPVVVAGLADVVAVAAGRKHSLALRRDGTVWAWGANESGQLGNGTTTSSSSPVAVAQVTGVVAVAAGGDHSLALGVDGSVWAWGANADGQLGNATTTSSAVPTKITGVTGAVAIAAGARHSLAAQGSGTTRAWGANTLGQLGNGTTTSSSTPVTVSGVSAAVAVAGGSEHSLALASDGTLRAWGSNVAGQLGTGSLVNSTTSVPVSGLAALQPVATARYGYDGDGLRVSKTVPRTTTAFAWDRSSGLPALLTEGSTSYVYGPGDRPLERIDGAGAVVYYHQDQLGSTRALTNQQGAVVATAEYDPYGRRTTTTGSISQPFGYAGEYTDAETGFQYLRARFYDPTTAQFLTRDPLEARTGAPYNYASNSPLNCTDPTGATSQSGGNENVHHNGGPESAECPAEGGGGGGGFNGIEYSSRISRTATAADHLQDVIGRLLPVRDRVADIGRLIEVEENMSPAIRAWIHINDYEGKSFGMEIPTESLE